MIKKHKKFDNKNSIKSVIVQPQIKCQNLIWNTTQNIALQELENIILTFENKFEILCKIKWTTDKNQIIG